MNLFQPFFLYLLLNHCSRLQVLVLLRVQVDPVLVHVFEEPVRAHDPSDFHQLVRVVSPQEQVVYFENLESGSLTMEPKVQPVDQMSKL